MGPLLLALCVLLPMVIHAADDQETAVRQVVSEAVRPVMERHGIPGMAVGIVLNGQTCVCSYGVASKESGRPVDGGTLFEVGSVSKTFTATLTTYAQATGQLSMTDPASKYLPALRGSAFDLISLVNLGTHTPGGMPLQVPGGISNEDQLIRYFQDWKPAYAPGTYRTYANPGIGLLGMIVARGMHEKFVTLMEGKLFPALGMKDSYLNVPKSRMERYAQGYTSEDVPARLSPGVLAAEAYGVRTTAHDLLRFVEANLRTLDLDEKWQRAVTDTHTGYFRVGAMTQDLIWEQYPFPLEPRDLFEGNSAKISYQANPVVRLDPPLPAQDDVFINKTGSTSGFAAYVAFIPARKVGIVLSANKSYPIDERIFLTVHILTHLPGTGPITRPTR